MLCYVDHHDNAYQWAERRKLETHPKTGAAQLVEVRKTVQEITVPSYAATDQDLSPKPLLFNDIPEEDLLRYGVPPDWIEQVRDANEDSLLELTEHLPSEAAEALLELAVGESPQFVQPAVAAAGPFEFAESRKVAESTAQYGVAADPFDHPDAQRRFRLMTNLEELERALDYPWDKWAVFLHPAQRQIVEKDHSGPFRVAGAAGTGKTIVAIHRAVFLARTNPDARVLLTTISDTLADVSADEALAVGLQRASTCGTLGSQRHRQGWRTAFSWLGLAPQKSPTEKWFETCWREQQARRRLRTNSAPASC